MSKEKQVQTAIVNNSQSSGSAVIYTRVGTPEQEKYGYSTQSQIDLCTTFAKINGYEVANIFRDVGSASKLDRPALLEMLEFCSKPENNIKAIIVWRLDRLTSNTMDYHGEIRPFLEKHNLKLLSATESNDDTIEGELLRNIGICFAEYEKKTCNNRIIIGMKHKAEQGYYPCKAPIGYKNTRDGLIVDEINSNYVKKAFELYDTGNYSISELSKELYKNGLKTKSGNKCYRSKLERILKNIIYTGSFMLQDKIYQGKYQPIISKELFDSVQEKLKK